MKHFDYIIAGAGCAGLSLLTRMLVSGRYADKKILLVDRAPKTLNDRTWCFWEKEEGFFESVVYKKWQELWFHGQGYSELHNIAPYWYKMIRGEDFYRYCFEVIGRYGNVTVEYRELDKVPDNGDVIFNSILFDKPVLGKNQFYLLQHFKGWVVETSQPRFNPLQATLMDFRVSQQHGTTFVYTMPFSATRALVEYTVFSEKVLADEAYEQALKDYIGECTVLEKEFGVIPMTNYRFPSRQGKVINIGTAGGQTKASSGYTFQFIQKQAESMVNGKPFVTPGRFHWYDSTLLNILSHKKLPGDYIFTQLFKHNKVTDILRFLDNETSLWEEMKIIRVLPKGIFTKAALQQLLP